MAFPPNRYNQDDLARELTTFAEPLASGLRDPAQMYQLLLTSGLQMAQILAILNSSYPGQTASGLPSNVTVIGDPLYAPYLGSLKALPLLRINGGSGGVLRL